MFFFRKNRGVITSNLGPRLHGWGWSDPVHPGGSTGKAGLSAISEHIVYIYVYYFFSWGFLCCISGHSVHLVPVCICVLCVAYLLLLTCASMFCATFTYTSCIVMSFMQKISVWSITQNYIMIHDMIIYKHIHIYIYIYVCVCVITNIDVCI